jgi:hypothetical protein
MAGYLAILVFSVMGVTPDQLIDKAFEITGFGSN